MPKVYSSRQIVKALQRAGFHPVSQKGSHLKLRGFGKGKLQTVIVPLHKEVAPGTFQSILNQADMSWEEFKVFLKR